MTENLSGFLDHNETDKTFRSELGRVVTDTEFCHFYHSMDFPDGTSVEGNWDLRGRFSEYIGNYPIAGKTVLDVGTSTGFLAFSAEQAGALSVTALDLVHVREICLVPFQQHPYFTTNDRKSWENETDRGWETHRNGFWYSHRKYQSKVEMVYEPLIDVRYWIRKFDVVMAGAIIEHLSDPVTHIGNIARLAKEAVIIGFTPVEDTDELLMKPITSMDDPNNYFTWWSLSRGLYRRIFDNVGFDIEIVQSKAFNVDANVEVERPTIIARRR